MKRQATPTERSLFHVHAWRGNDWFVYSKDHRWRWTAEIVVAWHRTFHPSHRAWVSEYP